METPKNCLDLYEFMYENGCPSEERACKFIYKILNTVIGCYHLGVIHRDIKPENILVNLDNLELTLIDFGGGSLVKRGIYNTKVGSDDFYPPEWHKNIGYHAEPMTVYSLGITLYYMIWGDVPFKTIDDICNAEVYYPIEMSSNCKKIIRKCLNKNPNERASLLDIFDDLEDYIQKMPNDTSNKVLPKKSKSMASTSNSSNDSSSTNSEFRRVTEELIEDNFFNVNAAKKRKYEKPQIQTDDSVSKKVKHEFDTEHQIENDSDETDIDTDAETEYESDGEIEKESEEPIIDSIDNYQFSKKVKHELDTKHQIENESDESDIDTGAETEYESDGEIEKESDEPIIDSIDNYQFATDDEFEDQSDSDTDDEINLGKSFIDVAADANVEAE